MDGKRGKIRLNFAFAAVQAHATFRLRGKSGAFWLLKRLPESSNVGGN